VPFFLPLQIISEDPESYNRREPVSADNKRIRIGDVGFIRRGQFHLLFHAGSSLEEVQLGDDVPTTFTPLTIGKTAFRDPRPSDCLHVGAVEEYGAGLGVMVPVPLCVLSLRPPSTHLKVCHSGRWNLVHISHSSSPGIMVRH